MDYQQKANILRALSLMSTTSAGSGHPTSCLSSADITSVLFDKYFTFDISNPENINNDRFVLSKGHAAPVLYSAFSLSGGIRREQLLSLRKFKSNLEGHPTPRFKFVDVASGSLGQGLSVSCGFALNAKLNSLSYKTYALLGDGEVAEGQVYEAANFASYYSLDNLITIIDVNNLGQTGKTMFDYDLKKYENIFISLGFEVTVIDGHNFQEIEKALELALDNKSKRPFVILAKTIKGKGVSFLEGREDFHGKVLDQDSLEKALLELSVDKNTILKDEVLFNLKSPKENQKNTINTKKIINNISYKIGDEIATREAFGDALSFLGQNDKIYGLDGDVANSTFLNKFGKLFPERFIECFIAEQNMASVALGLSVCGNIPIVATFSAFLTRAFDQIRMANISQANIKFIGSHSGISIGEDGPSQMGLEDIAMFSAIPGSIIIQPCDGLSCKKLIQKMIDFKGISYMRTLRPKTKVIYNEAENFEIGGSKLLRNSDNDSILVVASGITVYEALKAYEILLKEGIKIAVVDAYSIKPIDDKNIINWSKKCSKKTIITVEDHYINGGIGDILSAKIVNEDVKIYKLGVSGVPFSGDKDALFNEFKIGANSIIKKIKEILTNEN